MHYLSAVYLVDQPLHVSDIFVAHHQEVYCIYTTGTCCVFGPTNRQPTENTTRINCCICTVYLLMMVYKYARNM